MQTQAHTQAALQAQLESQERANVWWASLLRTRFEDDAVDVAWDEFKRPAATFQRQDKKKVVYQTQLRSIAVGITQVPSVRSPGSPARSTSPSSGSSNSASYRKTRKASCPSLSVCFSPRGRRAGRACLVGDPTSLEETVESDSERGE
ncbi:hypothetical protein Taro_023867 [Colocasia esculenta]|uniref:Uncharacterized protein n=1 Tax=Colocasia esculenta TaxID=4460 RepID=A0A843VIL8_COLES|nr:hypothetical protein [Colocasia esculenta]